MVKESAYMIEFKNINKTYRAKEGGVCALRNINLNVAEGEIFGVIGKSGAGKSTLIRCVNLLERPDSGEIWVNHREITHLSDKELLAVRSKIGMIFQHFNLLSSQTVYDNVAFPLKLQNYTAAQIKQTVLPLLELTELLDKQQHYPAQLSGGQKQRVAIARALVNKPSILLSDEATSALDPETTKSILSLLKEINKKMGLTILLITHEMDVIKAICDKVALIEKAEIVRLEGVFDFFTKRHDSENLEFLNTYLNHEIPEVLLKRLRKERGINTNPALRIYFKGQAADKPIMAHLIKDFNLQLNIMHGHIDYIKDQTMGVMIVEICSAYEDDMLQHCLAYLQREGLFVEVIGYVERNDSGAL